MPNPNEISLAEAVAMTDAYQNDSLFADQTIAVKASNDTYLDIINQTGCVAIRSYFAKNANGDLTLVIVGVDSNGNDMTAGKIMNNFDRCPTSFPQNSPLIP